MSAKLSTLFVALITFGLASSPAFARESGGGSKANLDLPFDAAGQEEEEEEAPEIVIFYDQQYEGDGIFFACDKSGSMSGAPWARLQREILKNVTQFSERVQFGIVFFDGHLKKFPLGNKPADATPAMKAAAHAMVMSTTTGAGSCYKEGILEALNFANNATVKRRLIIVLGDGEPGGVDGSLCAGDRAAYATRALAEVRSRNTTGVKINALCILCGAGESWMKNLAAQNGGTFAAVQG